MKLRKHCTCKTYEAKFHYLGCDLMYGDNFVPKKRKRFGLFYPMKVVRHG